MFIRYGIPLVAAGLLIFSVLRVFGTYQVVADVPPTVEPAKSPYPQAVAGAGVIEAWTQNIAIGTPVPGLVVEVAVEVGQKVQPGDLLFRLDDRQLRAERLVRQSALDSAQAQLKRLQGLPRPEDVPVVEAQLREAQANVVQSRDQLQRTRQLIERKVSTDAELVEREQQFFASQAQLARVDAQLKLLKAGSWTYDLDIARATVEQAAVQVKATEVELDRLEIRALVAGEVLQVNVRPGEFVGAPATQALIWLGDVDRLRVRVDIDEDDIPRFRPQTGASASVRGRPEDRFKLKFVRVEPYVIPKKSLTGDNTERVDTRVLQVIYEIENMPGKLYVGQQVDAFIEVNEEASRPLANEAVTAATTRQR